MRIQKLTLSKEKGKRENADTLTLERDRGVPDDYRSAKDGSVSLLSSEAEQKIRAAGGLCTDRFSANIFTVGVDYAALRVGMRLQIGQCTLEISRVGKPCFESCGLIQNQAICPLPLSCAFSVVVCGGTLRPGDPIEVITL